MAYVLIVPAFKFSDPIEIYVLMISDDPAIHLVSRARIGGVKIAPVRSSL
jgi:hypothetical protein